MFSNRQGLIDGAVSLIQNERAGRGLDRDTVTAQVGACIAMVSRVSPRVISGTLDGTGSAYQFTLSALTNESGAPTPSWVPGQSRIIEVEYPTGNQLRTILDPEGYYLYPATGYATKLHFETTTPASGTANIRVIWSTLHTISDTESSVQDHEEPAYENALAGIACNVYAAKYGHSTDPSIDADAIDYKSKAEFWLRLAASLFGTAASVLGVSVDTLVKGPGGGGSASAGGSDAPAGAFHEWDPGTRVGSQLIFGSRGRR